MSYTVFIDCDIMNDEHYLWFFSLKGFPLKEDTILVVLKMALFTHIRTCRMFVIAEAILRLRNFQ